MDKKKETRLCKYLRTITKRDGIDRVVIGVIIARDDIVLLKKDGDIYCVPSGEIKANEEIISAVRRIAKELTRSDSFSIKRYLFSFDLDAKTRQYNFEVSSNIVTTRNDCRWVKITGIADGTLQNGTKKILKKLLLPCSKKPSSLSPSLSSSFTS